MKKQQGASDIIFPVPVALIVSGGHKEPNIITIAWIGMMGSTPPTLAVSLRYDRYSLELIRRIPEFTVNIPSDDHFREVDYCGLVTGRKRNKFKDTGFTPIKASIIDTPIIAECPYNLECKVVKEVELGEWVVIFGEVVETHIDADKINTEKSQIDIAKVKPMAYCATIREYWTLGNQLAKGFDAGRTLIEDF